ncbi:hypothetical protein ACHAW5_008318 [Stephanodiscus triporus]|uniref:CDP-diacylglycerol--glycerol-3-phosphate 3-phosphatidyltransferase n=1 Tax=Stephanodiscus triporus TaxID=2934178 RepID=A0ABD3QMJ2_9STRA
MSSSFSSPSRFGRPSSAGAASSVAPSYRGLADAAVADATRPALLPVFVVNVVPRGGSSSSSSSDGGGGGGIVDETSGDVVVPDPSASHHVEHSPVHTARHPYDLIGGGGPSSSSSSSSKIGPNAPPPGPIRRLLPGFPWHALPNYLTYARCLSIPIFLLLSYYPLTFPSRAPVLSVLFALASFTDWLDGYLARRWGVVSPFGAFLDPVADKLMVSTALIVLSGRYGGIVAIPSSIILAREVGVSALREWMAQRGKRDSVKVGMQGKVKAALTMISITLLLLVPEGVGLESVGWIGRLLGSSLGTGGSGCVVAAAAAAGGTVVDNIGLSWMLGPSLIMIFASAVITVTSGSVYFRAAAPVLLGKE